MALTFNNIVDACVSQFGVSTATASVWVNERAGRMVAESEYLTKNTSLTATTVVDQNAYELDADTVDVRSVWVDGDPYSVVSYEAIQDVEAGRRSLSGDGGVVARYFSAMGVPELYLYPAPSTTGSLIEVEESVYPDDSVYSGQDNLSLYVPKHIRSYVQDGAFADGYEQQDERQDLAQMHEQRYEQGIELLRRLRNRRLGGGVQRISLRGRW